MTFQTNCCPKRIDSWIDKGLAHSPILTNKTENKRHSCPEPERLCWELPSPSAAETSLRSRLKSLERGREEFFFGGGGISWLTRNFLSSRTNVTGELHHFTPQRFGYCQKKHKKFSAEERRTKAAAKRPASWLQPWSERAREAGYNCLLQKGASKLLTSPPLPPSR